MQVDPSTSQLMLTAYSQPPRTIPRDPVQMARLANRYASEMSGLAPGREPDADTHVYLAHAGVQTGTSFAVTVGDAQPRRSASRARRRSR